MAQTEVQFKKMRSKGIGGSDVAGIFGLSKWSSPLSVYLQKIGEHPDDNTDNQFTKWGKILEAPIAAEFQSVTGKKIKRVNKTLVSKSHEFVIAHIDRDIIGENAGLEVKTAVEYKRSDWESGVPTPYILQCLHYMYVTESDHWYIAVLIGGNHFDWFVIERDEDAIRMMLNKEVQFWKEHVMKRIPPAPNHLDAKLLSKVYPGSNTDILSLDNALIGEVQALIKIKESIKNLESRQDEIENILKSKIGEYQAGTIGNYLINWKPQEVSRFDSTEFRKEHPNLFAKFAKKSQFRKFNIKELKR